MKIALDTETTGLNPNKDKIIGVSMSNGKKSDYKEFKAVDKKKLTASLAKDDCIFQNAKFDIRFFLNHGFKMPEKVHDTMIASYLLDETAGRHNLEAIAKRFLGVEGWKGELKDYMKEHKLESFADVPMKIIRPYAAKDAEYTYKVFEKVYPMLKNQGLLGIYEHEMELLKAIIEIEERGVKIDVKLLKELDKKLAKQQVLLEKAIYKISKKKFNIGSEDDLIEVLYTKLGLPVLERSWKTQKPATDKDTLERLKHKICPLISEWRTASKMRSTYCQPLQEKSSSLDILRCSFNQIGARTGRFSSENPNLQNVPNGHDIRKAFICRPDYYNFYFDYKQEEVVIYAYFSRDPFLLPAVQAKKDIHDEMAFKFYGRRDFTHDERAEVKAITFGIIYGMGANGLSKRLRISKDEAWKIFNKYYESFPTMKKYNQDLSDKVRQDGSIKNPFGRVRRIAPDKAYIAVNTLVQGTCGDILKDAMIRIHELLAPTKSHILITIHDELVIEIHKSELHLVKEIKRELETFPQFDVPLQTDIEWTKTNWAAKEPYNEKL